MGFLESIGFGLMLWLSPSDLVRRRMLAMKLDAMRDCANADRLDRLNREMWGQRR